MAQTQTIITKVSDSEVKHIVVTPDPLVGKRKNIPLDKDFEQMLVSAERYACGRMTYIVSDTIRYIDALLPHLSDWCLCVMMRDIAEERKLCNSNGAKMGMECDHREWLRLEQSIVAELERRNNEDKT